MAKRKKAKLPERRDPTEALAQMERPTIKWKVIAQIAIAVGVLWLIAGMLTPYISYWGFVVAGVLTLVIVGFGLYVWNMLRKSTAIVDILKGATDEKGRAEALAKLQSGKGGNDAIGQMAQAQLVAQDDPKEAVRILESIDLDKAPKAIRGDVRAQLALMHLVQNRASDARVLADQIDIDAQPQPKQRALYAAVMAEAFSRTGKHEEAAELLEDYDPEDPDYAEVKPFLLRAQVFTYLKQKKKGRARTAMMRLAKADANQLGAFLQKGSHPKVKALATEVLQREGIVPKQKVKFQRQR